MKHQLNVLSYLIIGSVWASCSPKEATAPVSEQSSEQRVIQLVDRAARVAEPKQYAFQSIQAPVRYLVAGESESQPVFEKSIAPKEAFLEASGIPCSTQNRLLMAEKMTWQEADKRYQSYVENQADHNWLPIFRQAAASYILINTALLADTTLEGKTKTAFYFQQYMDNNGWKEPGLGYFGLKALSGFWPAKKTKEVANQLIDGYSNSPTRKKLQQLVANSQVWQKKTDGFAVKKMKGILERKESYLRRIQSEF